MHQAEKKAIVALKDAARRSGDERLAQLAGSLSGGHVGEVIHSID